MNNAYKNIYGTWEVTTEGDCEGYSIRRLGTFRGFVDEIALHLANKAYYKLRFKLAEIHNNPFSPTADKISVSFDIDSETWDTVKTDAGLQEIKEVFKDRPVTIEESNSFASFVIKSKNSDEIKRKNALSKLTDDDIKILGLEEK